MKRIYKLLVLPITMLIITSCNDFLDTPPLSNPSDGTFWSSYERGMTWINYAYEDLPTWEDYSFDAMSDDAYGKARGNADLVANGTFEPSTNITSFKWEYKYIRHCLELMDRLDIIPNLTTEQRNNLAGQARFIIAYRYFEMTTLYQDVPLVKEVLSIEDSDIPKTPKAEVLEYLLEQLDLAIAELPISWSSENTGRATKGAALALKARVMLYNGNFKEAAKAAKEVITLKDNDGNFVYDLHPNYNELFVDEFNNKTKEVILARQYAQGMETHTLTNAYGIYAMGGSGLSQPLPDLGNSYECTDGLPISESPLFDPQDPWKNRDPRFLMNFIIPFETIDGILFDPINNKTEQTRAKSYIYFRKYIANMKNQQRDTYVNWIIFRLADVLLMYAEAENEVNGPSNEVYDAIDRIRQRANVNMPAIDRNRYNTKEKLREAIRNERRVELAGEGLRYYDIIRWRIAETVLNKQIKSYEIPGVLPVKIIEKRVFDPAKNYVWPIPQSAIDKANNLVQHPAWG